MTDIKTAFETYKRAIAAADAADAAWENDPESEECEAAFDAAYKNQNNAMLALCGCIVEFTNGAIEYKTARRMVVSKFDEIESLISRVA